MLRWLREVDRWFIDSVLPHGASFRAYARRLIGDASEAEDLVQEAYAQVLSGADWRRIVSPDRFILRTIRNLACDRVRRANVVHFKDVAALEAAPDPLPGPAEQVQDRDELQRVLAAVQRLPPQCRKVVLMRRAEGLSPREIAEKLRISVSTVEKHLAKGLRLLTHILADEELGFGGARVAWAPDRRKIVRR